MSHAVVVTGTQAQDVSQARGASTPVSVKANSVYVKANSVYAKANAMMAMPVSATLLLSATLLSSATLFFVSHAVAVSGMRELPKARCACLIASLCCNSYARQGAGAHRCM